MQTPIANEVEAMHAANEGVENAFTREQALLAANGPPPPLLAVGLPLPNAMLLNAYGEETTLYAQLASRRAVIVLYRGVWCPYCNLTLRVYQRELVDRLAALDSALIAISPQLPDGSLSMRDKYDLSFPVLSDPGNAVARALGVLTRPSADALEAQRELGLHLDQVNADGTVELPMPSVAVVDAGANLVWLDVHPDYSTRSEPAEIIAQLTNATR